MHFDGADEALIEIVDRLVGLGLKFFIVHGCFYRNAGGGLSR
jgi:hypothetical protein